MVWNYDKIYPTSHESNNKLSFFIVIVLMKLGVQVKLLLCQTHTVQLELLLVQKCQVKIKINKWITSLSCGYCDVCAVTKVSNMDPVRRVLG